MRGRERAPATGGGSWPSSDTHLGVLPIGYGDGWRRGLSNNADVLIAGRRHPLVGTVSMDNITVDLGTDARVAAAARRAGDPDRRPGQRADHRRGGRPGGWTRSTTRSPVRSPRACRGSTTATALLAVGRRCRCERRAGQRHARRSRAGGRGWWAAPCATALLGRDDGRPRRGRRRRPRRGRAGGRAGGGPRRVLRPVGGVRRLAGGGARPLLAARRGAAARRQRSRPTWRCATSRSTRSPSRSRAERRSTRSAVSRTSRRGACAWPARARSPTIRCGCCGWCGSRSSSISRPSRARCAAPARRRRRAAAASRPSGCSWSCAGSSPPRGRGGVSS